MKQTRSMVTVIVSPTRIEQPILTLHIIAALESLQQDIIWRSPGEGGYSAGMVVRHWSPCFLCRAVTQSAEGSIWTLRCLSYSKWTQHTPVRSSDFSDTRPTRQRSYREPWEVYLLPHYGVIVPIEDHSKPLNVLQ